MSESNATELIKYLTEDNLKLMYGRLNRRYVVVDALPPVDSLDPADRNVIYVVKETVAGTVRYWPNVIDNDAWKPFGIGQTDLDGKADKVDAVEGHLVVSDGNGGLSDADIMPGTFVALAIDPSESIQPHATDLRKIWKAYQSGMPVALLDNRPGGTGLYAQLNAAGYTWADGDRMAECLDGVDDDNRQCDGTVHGYCTESDGVVRFYEDAGHTVEIVPENGKLYCDDTVPDSERVYRYNDGFVRALRFVQFSCNELVDDDPAWPSRRATRQVFYRMTEPYGSSSPDGFEVVYGESTADIHDQMVTGARIGEGKLLPVDDGVIVLPKSTAVNDGKLTVTVGESEPVVFTANDSADRAVVIPVATGEVAGLVRIASAVDPGDPDAAVTAAAVLDELDGYVQKADGATGGNFAELDDNGNLTDSGSKASDFKPKQAAVTDPTASGSGIEFIDSITQDTNGVIVPSKKSVQAAVASTAGVGGNAGVMSATDKEKLDGIDNYIESASVTGRTLTLTPKAGTPVQFTDTGDSIITGIDGLKAADPELGKVIVVGYWTDDDCEARTYVWNSTSTETADDGYIVESTESVTGRWILEFDGEWLPSTYYGVYPGHEANMNALLSYPTKIGDGFTAPGVYFKPGSYTGSSEALTTAKKVLIDSTSIFSYSSITSRDEITVIGGATNHRITDLYGVKKAHVSWYNSLQGFLDSGAKELVFDQRPNFNQNPILTKNTSLIGVHLVNPISFYCGYFQFGKYYLYLNNCTVDDYLFDPSSCRVQFANMVMTDRYFYNPTAANMDRSRAYADPSTLRLRNFDNAEVFLKLYYNGYLDVDMEGRTVGDLDFAPSLTSLKNCNFNSLTLNDARKSVLLENCTGTLSGAVSGQLHIRNCNLSIDANLYTLSGADSLLHIEDSVISGSGSIQAGTGFALLIENSTVEVPIRCYSILENPGSQTYDVTIKNSIVTGDIEVKRLTMTNSRAGTVKIYGAARAIGSLTLENNVIDDFSFNSVTNYESIVRDCVFVNTRIVNNTFNNSFTCPFVVRNGSTNYEFISRTANHNYYYRGNHGNCPIDSVQLATTLPYSGYYQDSDGTAWTTDLSHPVRLFMAGDPLVLGTSLGSKMIELCTTYGSGTEAIDPSKYGLLHAGVQSSQYYGDYFSMLLATTYSGSADTVLASINTEA